MGRILFLLAVTSTLSITQASCFAQGNKANRAKVTGSYSVKVGNGIFDAHIEAFEATETKPVDGFFFWTGVRNGQEYSFIGSVYEVIISGNEALVFVQVETVINATHIPFNGTFVYHVVDAGSSGKKGDTMALTWLTGTNVRWGPVPLISGNLTVHSK